jgi:hypothetical protein
MSRTRSPARRRASRSHGASPRDASPAPARSRGAVAAAAARRLASSPDASPRSSRETKSSFASSHASVSTSSFSQSWRSPARAADVDVPQAVSRDRHWSDEQYVDSLTYPFFYQSHSLIALGECRRRRALALPPCARSCPDAGMALAAMVTGVFVYNPEVHTTVENWRVGLAITCFVFLVFGLLVFPSGPFIRPHPAFWRVVFGVTVIYQGGLMWLLFQKKDDGRKSLKLFDERLGVQPVLKEYAADCALTYQNVKNAVLDIFVISHFLGNAFKAVLLRDRFVLWTLSVGWEFLELALLHMLPNFAECWWDQFILDILVCNALGFELGLWMSRRMSSFQYKWSHFEEQSFSGKFKRMLKQFTPERWTQVAWESRSNLKRVLLFHVVVIIYQWVELSAFFLKHVLWIPSESLFNILRLCMFLFSGECGRVPWPSAASLTRLQGAPPRASSTSTRSTRPASGWAGRRGSRCSICSPSCCSASSTARASSPKPFLRPCSASPWRLSWSTW